MPRKVQNKALAIMALLLSLSSGPVLAREWEVCFALMEDRYQLPRNILKAIAINESSLNPRAINKKNSNGSEDIGLMQINSSHFGTLKKYGIGRDDLLDPCTNIRVGAWLLWENIVRFGLNWKAVGAYHSYKDEGRQRWYVARVANTWKKLNERNQ